MYIETMNVLHSFFVGDAGPTGKALLQDRIDYVQLIQQFRCAWEHGYGASVRTLLPQVPLSL